MYIFFKKNYFRILTIFSHFADKKHEKGIKKKKGRSVVNLGRVSTERPEAIKNDCKSRN